MEEGGAQGKVWGKDAGAHALSPHATLPQSLRVHARSSLNPILLGFLWRLHYVGMIDQTTGYSCLNATSSPSPFPGGQVWG